MNRLNCSSYFVMKNTPKVGLVSNFWGAVQKVRFLFLVGQVENYFTSLTGAPVYSWRGRPIL